MDLFLEKLHRFKGKTKRHKGFKLPDISISKVNIPPKRFFDNITLVCIDCVEVGRAIKSLEICKYFCDFKEVKFFTSLSTTYPHIEINKISSQTDYSEFIYYNLYDYINTDFILICQHDGWICNPTAWKDEWFNFDYIGAKCGFAKELGYGGNGGFSLRSKKLLKWLRTGASSFKKHIDYKWEDKLISVIMLRKIQRDGFLIPTIAQQEGWAIDMGVWNGEFGHHKCNLSNWKFI